VATSTLRAVILVAAVVLGIFGITKAFPDNGTQALAPPPGQTTGPESPSPSTSTSTSPRARPSTPAPSRKPRIKGVVVLVLNGSGKTGQASLTAQTLQNAGYTVRPPGNSPHISKTTVYYAPDAKIDAQGLLDRYFPGAELKPAPSDLASGVDVEVVLGEDFGASASPTA
jgi:hypothetical protein